MGKAMKDKLAEEILKTSCAENKVFLTSNEWHTIIEAMQAYYEAKKKKEIEKACKKEYAKGFKEGQIAEANYSKSEI